MGYDATGAILKYMLAAVVLVFGGATAFRSSYLSACCKFIRHRPPAPVGQRPDRVEQGVAPSATDIFPRLELGLAPADLADATQELLPPGQAAASRRRSSSASALLPPGAGRFPQRGARPWGIAYSEPMKTFTALLVVVVACTCAVTACSGSSETGTPPGATAASDTPTAPLGEGVTVTHVSGSELAEATSGDESTTAVARVDGASVLLTLTDFVYYCAPPPTFAARMEGEVLVVQAEPPSSPGTRCIGPHSAVLRVDAGSAAPRTVSIRDMQGLEVATTKVTGRD